MMTSPGLKRGWRGFDSDMIRYHSGRFDEKEEQGREIFTGNLKNG